MSKIMEMRRLCVVALVLTAGLCLAVPVARAANTVVVESKSVSPGATGVSVGVYLENDVPLNAVILPLEVRTVDGAFVSGTFTFAPQGRIASGVLDSRTLLYYADPDVINSCSGPASSTWSSGSTVPSANGSPDAVLWVGLRSTGASLPPGSDSGVPSLMFTLDIDTVEGSFEIDTMCVAPENHLLFHEDGGGDVTVVFSKGVITVEAPGNLCPVLVAADVDSVAVEAGDLATNHVTAVDLEGDPVEYFLVSGPGVVDQMTGNWEFVPGCIDEGVHVVAIEATDRGAGGCPSSIASFNVIVSVPGLTVDCGENFSVLWGETASRQVTASGGCPPYVFSVTSGPGVIDPNLGLWLLSTNCADVGDAYWIEFTVMDENETFVTCTLSVDVINNTPVCSSISAQASLYGVPMSVVLGPSSDLDGQSLTYSIFAGTGWPGEAIVDTTYTVTRPFSDPEPHVVYFEVFDGCRSDTCSFTINEPVNRPPVLTPIPNQTVLVGNTLEITVSATDPDGTIPVLTARSLPAGAWFVDNFDGTGFFSYYASPLDVGYRGTRFFASDGDLEDSDTVTFTIVLADSVAVESKKVALGATDVDVRVRLVNPTVPLWRIRIPLDIRAGGTGSFVTALGMSFADRMLNPSILNARSAGRIPTPTLPPCYDAVLIESILGLPPQPVAATPEGALFKGAVPMEAELAAGTDSDIPDDIRMAAVASPYLPAGTDTEGSLVLTVDVNSTPGTFDIVRGCVQPSDTLAFWDGDYTYVPHFAAGTITINSPPVTRDSCVEVQFGSAIAVQLPVIDADDPAGALTYTLVQPPSEGTTIDFNPATGVYEYEAPGGELIDSIMFSVTDGYDVSATGRFCFEVVAVAPDTVWVSEDGDDGNAGTESSPFRTIAHAMASKSPNLVIMVKPGTYAESVFFPYRKTVKLISTDGPFVTFLAGQGPGTYNPVVVMDGGSSIYEQEINGFTITGNIVSDGCDYCVGGIMVVSPSKAHILNNIVIGNSGYGAVGGIDYEGFGGLVANNWIIGNTGVARPVFGAPSTPQPGGVKIRSDAGVYFANNTVAFNSASDSTAGAGISIVNETSLNMFDNNIIAFNQPGRGFKTEIAFAALTMNNCLYFGNGDANAVPAGVSPKLAPAWVFVDPRFRDNTGDNYRLSCFSPARDVGRTQTLTTLNALFPGMLDVDIDGQPRTSFLTVDIGGDEFYDDAKIAAFAPSPASGCAPLNVVFTNESQCLDEQWYWDFGDGTTLSGSGSFNKNPPHTYEDAGVYRVRLVALGDDDADTTYDTVRVGVPFTAGFEADVVEGCAGITVNFTPSATADVDSYHWEFGDGGTSDLPAPRHVYDHDAAVVYYDVTLTLTNVCDTVTVLRPDYIKVLGKPTAVITSSLDGVSDPVCAPYTVHFEFVEASEEFDSVRWDFGDNTRSTEFFPDHTYLVGKTYSVLLTAYGDCDSVRLVRSPFFTFLQRPTAVLHARTSNVDTLFCCVDVDTARLTVDITGETAEPEWLLGDGNVLFGSSVEHVYTTIDRYLPKVVLRHDCGIDTLPIGDTLVVGTQPVADFTVEADSVYQPDPIVFTDLSLNNPRAWHWTFGDGDTAIVSSPQHVYQPGTYDVGLHVANSCGADTATDRTVRAGGFLPLIVDSLDAQGDTVFYSVQLDALVLAYDHPVYLSGRLTPTPRRGSMTFAFTQSSGVPPYTATMRAIRSSDLSTGSYTITLRATDSLRFNPDQTPYTKQATRPFAYKSPGFLKIDPSPMAMGKAAIGNPISQDLVLTNTADHDTVVVQEPLLDGLFFAVFGSGGTLAPGATARWTVQFTPTRKGDFTAKVRVRSNDPAKADSLVPVTAKAVAELRPPRVAITQPATGLELRIDKPLKFEFDERMRIVPLDTILLIRSARTGASVPGTGTFTDNRHVSFVPTVRFTPDDTLSVRFRSCVTDTNSNFLDGDADGIEEGTPVDDFLAGVPTGPGVYPGDTDNDGTVNERDILPLGRFLGSIGTPRDDNGSVFALQPATAWVPRDATYADADGNGDIDSMDICPIADFFDSDVDLPKLTLEGWLAAAEQWSGDVVDQLIAGLEYCNGQTAGHAALREILLQMKQTTPQPSDYALAQNYPNPFNPSTVISYTLPHDGEVRLEVFDVRGRRVVILDSGFQNAGRHWKVWDGRDDDGHPVASGVYFYRLETRDFRFARKMVLLK